MATTSAAATIECFFTLQYYAKLQKIAKYLVAVTVSVDLIISPVFKACILLLLVCRPAFRTGCAFAKAVSERQARPGAISDTLKIEEQRIAYP